MEELVLFTHCMSSYREIDRYRMQNFGV